MGAGVGRGACRGGRVRTGLVGEQVGERAGGKQVEEHAGGKQVEERAGEIRTGRGATRSRQMGEDRAVLLASASRAHSQGSMGRCRGRWVDAPSTQPPFSFQWRPRQCARVNVRVPGLVVGARYRGMQGLDGVEIRAGGEATCRAGDSAKMELVRGLGNIPLCPRTWAQTRVVVAHLQLRHAADVALPAQHKGVEAVASELVAVAAHARQRALLRHVVRALQRQPEQTGEGHPMVAWQSFRCDAKQSGIVSVVTETCCSTASRAFAHLHSCDHEPFLSPTLQSCRCCPGNPRDHRSPMIGHLLLCKDPISLPRP